MTGKRVLKFMVKLAKAAGKKIKKIKIHEMQKNISDVVTNADLSVEAFLVLKIRKKFKDICIVSEEFNNKAELKSECFIIDPIDGTINFLNGVFCWGIQIAYQKNNITQAAVIYMPAQKELFYAARGHGAFLNKKKITATKKPANKCIYTIDGSSNKEYKQKILDEMKLSSRNFRNFGAICTSFSLLAKGAINGVAFLKYTHWDVAAGLLICKEAGCAIIDVPPRYALAASTDEFLSILKTAVEKHWEE